MGWYFRKAIHFKDGQIDLKAECDDEFTWQDARETVRVLESVVVDSVYYAAVEVKTEETTDIVGGIIHTHVDGYMIGTKVMDETFGPFACKCPIGILNLLSPTGNRDAMEWREDCRRYYESQRRA